jgi:hypothetical protein
MEFLVFGGLLGFPVLIYWLKAVGVLSPRASDAVLGIGCILVGICFLAFCVVIFAESGQTIHPSRHGPHTVLAGQSGLDHAMAAAFCALLGCGVIYAGWSFLKTEKSRH